MANSTVCQSLKEVLAHVNLGPIINNLPKRATTFVTYCLSSFILIHSKRNDS